MTLVQLQRREKEMVAKVHAALIEERRQQDPPAAQRSRRDPVGTSYMLSTLERLHVVRTTG